MLFYAATISSSFYYFFLFDEFATSTLFFSLPHDFLSLFMFSSLSLSYFFATPYIFRDIIENIIGPQFLMIL